MKSMFSNCRTLNNLNINNWNVSRCLNFLYFFSDSRGLSDTKISNWRIHPNAKFIEFYGQALAKSKYEEKLKDLIDYSLLD